MGAALKPKLSLTADQLSAAAEFLRSLTALSTEIGVYLDGPFVIELPAPTPPGAGPKVQAAWNNNLEEGGYVLTGVTDG